MTSDNTPGGSRFDTGAELKRIRGGRTQKEFADLLGVGTNTVARYENNDRVPDAEYLFKLNLLFGVDPSRIILGREAANLISQRETKLLTNFRSAEEEDKLMIERLADFAAQKANAKGEKPT